MGTDTASSSLDPLRPLLHAPRMARGATIYPTRLDLSLVDRDVYAEVTTRVARHPSETHERTLARILAYALCYEEGLEFGRGVSATEEPDLWSREGDGRPRHWIEVGQPDAKRLVKAARQSERATLFAFGEGLERWRQTQLDGLDAPRNLSILRLDDTFLAALAGSSDRQIRWSVTLSDGIIYVATGDKSFETRLDPLLGELPA
jgi:uncharacterized protein YaeQ